MFGLIIMAVIVWVGWSIYQAHKHKEWVQEQTNKAMEIESRRGDDITHRIGLSVANEDLPKIGYNQEFDGLIFLFSVRDGTVHFSYEQSPALHLKTVEFQAHYSQQTNGTVSGRSGSAAVGGLLFGNVGASMGSARKRKVNTTTKNVEESSQALLTFVRANGGIPFTIQCTLITADYDSLVKDFVWKDPIKESPVSKSDIDALSQLGKLHESGILTDEEFALKKSQILAK